MAEYFISFEDAHHELLAAATYLAERIKSGDGHAAAMTAVVPLYLSNGNVDLAAELANTVDDPFTRDKLLSLVAEKCAEIDDDEYAVQLAEAVEEFGLRSQTFEKIAMQKVGKGEVEKAIEIAESMPHPDYVFAAAATRLAADGKKDRAVDLMSRIEFPGATVIAFESMAMNELATGNKDDCIALLDQAKDAASEIEHNEERIRTLCEIGNRYVDAGRNDLAIRAYDAAKVDAEQLDNIHRDAFVGASALGFLHAGSFDLADRALDLLTDKTQMANCLLAFARHYWEKGEKDDALEALDEAFQILRSQRDIETRDSRARYALFGSLAAQFAGFEKGERAIGIAQEIEDENQRTAALSQIAAVLTLRREDVEARHALNAIADDADRVFALIGMSDAKEKNGDRSDAIALLDEAAHLTEAVPQLTARSSAYNEIASRFNSYTELDKTAAISRTNLETIAMIRDASSRAVGLAHLAEQLERTEIDPELLGRDRLLNILRLSS